MANLLIQPAPMPSLSKSMGTALQMKAAQNQNLLAARQLQDYSEEKKWRSEERGRQRTTWNREDEAYKRGVERLKFKDEADALEYLIKSSPMINWQNYPDSRQYLIDMGLNPAALPEPEAIYGQAMEAGADPSQFFEAWKNKALMTGQQRLELLKEELTPKAPVMGSEAWKRAKEFEAGLVKGEKDPEFIKKRNEMMEVYGVDEKTATGLATGTLRINTNPVSGESVIVDMVTGTSRPITETEAPSTETKKESSQTTPKKQTLWEMSDLSTGILSAGKAAWGATAGQVGLPIAKKTEYARQRVRSAQQKLIRSLSINPRYPVAEMERIKSETRIAPEIFDSSQSLRVRMRAVNDYLESEIITNQSIASNPKMPTEQRKNALQSVEAMQSFLRELGVPKENTRELEKQSGANLSKEDTDLINKYLTK